MRIFARSHGADHMPMGIPLGPKSYKPIVMSTQTFVMASDLLKQLKTHVQKNGNIDTLFVQMDNTNIPIKHENELDLVSKMAVAYHNSLLETNVKCQKDLYGNSYTQLSTDEDKLENFDNFILSDSDQYSDAESWDSEVDGDRVVYDASFEQNADLVPWEMHCEDKEERFGL